MPRVSFIIPAHNEAAYLGESLAALHHAARPLGGDYEVIVANDASTDATGDIARSYGARVVDVNRRQISAVRNAGAAVASGDTFVFVDADTLLPARTLRDALRALRRGSVGGGAMVRFDDDIGWWTRLSARMFTETWLGILRWAAGCFVFVRRPAFEAVGGFDEHYFIGEEMVISRALKRLGHFAIVRSPVITSARKLRRFSLWETNKTAIRLIAQGPAAWRRRDGLGLWYEDMGPHGT